MVGSTRDAPRHSPPVGPVYASTHSNRPKESPPAAHLSLPSAGGLYCLALKLTQEADLAIGRLGVWTFPEGIHLYVGSACGPGGLAARLGRHLRPARDRRVHWHVDWLNAQAAVTEIWWLAGRGAAECRWSSVLGAHGDRIVPGFGASDCGCPGHLITLRHAQALVRAYRALDHHCDGSLERARCQPCTDRTERRER
jgi:Uri superfamily endonuclease